MSGIESQRSSPFPVSYNNQDVSVQIDVPDSDSDSEYGGQVLPHGTGEGEWREVYVNEHDEEELEEEEEEEDEDEDEVEEDRPDTVDKLVRPPSLFPAGLAIQQQWRMLVCEDCHCAITRSSIKNHFMKVHSGASILPDDLPDILDHYNIPMGQVEHPTYLVAPIQSIPIIKKGFRCTVPGCGYATVNKPSGLKFHTAKQHKGMGGAKLLRPSALQQVYKSSGGTYWAVESNLATFSGERDEITGLLRTILDTEEDRLMDATFHPPIEERTRTPFNRAFNWDLIVQGVEWEKLMDLVAYPNSKTEPWKDIPRISCLYFDSIRPLVKGFPALALQWLNTDGGCVLFTVLILTQY